MASSVPKEVKNGFVATWLPATEATWKVALYNNVSALSLTAYSTTNEISGTGYTAGGATIAGRVSGYVDTNNVYLDATDTAWSGATFTAQYAVVYYANGSTNPVRFRYDFGSARAVTTGTFTILWNASGLVKVS